VKGSPDQRFFWAKFLQNEKIKIKRQYSFVIFHFLGEKAPNFEKKNPKKSQTLINDIGI
jgi:hypothetical protein